jgi:hypothetical protein
MDIKVEKITDLDQCKTLWQSIVIEKTLYDNFDFRVAFYDSRNPLNFIAAYDNDLLVGLLPLQMNTVKGGYLEFFGGKFMEYNRIYAKDGSAEIKGKLIGAIDGNADLNSMMAEDEFIKSFPFQDNTYNLEISNLHTLTEFIEQKFVGHTRNRFKKKLKNFAELEHKVELGRFEDLDKMMELNKMNFGEESSFHENAISTAFHKLLKTDFKINMISVLINDIPESVSYFLEYKDEFHYLMAATNRNSVRDLGNYITFKTLEYAMQQNKFKVFEAGRNNCGWKEVWHFEPHPIHIFKNFEDTIT